MNQKPAPVAPKPDDAPKPPVEEKKVEEAPKKEEAPAEEAPVQKVDLKAIKLHQKVPFKTLDDGVKMGILTKNSKGKYIAMDKFEFVDDENSVIRIKK